MAYVGSNGRRNFAEESVLIEAQDRLSVGQLRRRLHPSRQEPAAAKSNDIAVRTFRRQRLPESQAVSEAIVLMEVADRMLKDVERCA
jgi:hypothetical protein